MKMGGLRRGVKTKGKKKRLDNGTAKTMDMKSLIMVFLSKNGDLQLFNRIRA